MENILHTSHPSTAARFLRAAAAPFTAFWWFLVHLGEASPMMVAIDRLSETSDEELQARGVTRRDEILRIVGTRALL